jgi:hypothetical protein
MFGKVIHIIITLLLVTGTAGVTFTQHYCGNKLVATSVFVAPHTCCGTHCKACHNETISLKVMDTFIASSFQVEGADVLTIAGVLPSMYLMPVTGFSLTSNLSNQHAPPLIFSNSTAFLQTFRC